MATQLGVAFSSEISGIGQFAAGPYYCAQGEAKDRFNRCFRYEEYSADKSFSTVDKFFVEGKIDNPSNLKETKVFLYTGLSDHSVLPVMTKKSESFYEKYMSKDEIKVIEKDGAQHTFPTDFYGENCRHVYSPWISNCHYDLAHDALAWLNPKEQKASTKFNPDQFYSFYQGNTEAEMDMNGYIYVPAACERKFCPLHVALHGCDMDTTQIGTKFVEFAGYN